MVRWFYAKDLELYLAFHEGIIDEMGIGYANCITEQLKTESDIKKCFGRGEPILVVPEIPYYDDKDEDQDRSMRRVRRESIPDSPGSTGDELRGPFSGRCLVCDSENHEAHRLIILTDSDEVMQVGKKDFLDYLLNAINRCYGCVHNIQLHGSQYSMIKLGLISSSMKPNKSLSSFVSGQRITPSSGDVVFELHIHYGLGSSKDVISWYGYQPKPNGP
tara:strand:- start:128 stop:781 length:654 start_codon:yes stop_codon:yes gene_type:complete